MRTLPRILIGLGVVAVGAVGLLWIFQGRVVKAAIQSGGTWATGVPTQVDDVSAGLLGGELELTGLTVANPPGFAAKPFVAVGTARADWETRSLFSDEVHVEELAIDGLALHIERNASGTNYKKILEHAKTRGKDEPKKESGESKRVLVVDRIVLTNVTAELVLGDLPVATGPLSVTVPRIELKQFRSDGSTSEVVGQLLSVVVEAAMSAALEAGQGIFPQDLMKDLQQQLESGSQELKDVLEGTLKDAGKGFEGLNDVFGEKKKP
jgi:hypothetical protein